MSTTSRDLKKAFATNATYFEMLRQRHTENGKAPFLEKETLLFISRFPPGTTILDAGSGDGSIAVWLAENCPNCNIIGVDISPKGVEMGKQLAKKKKLKNIVFKVDDLEKLSLKDESVDFIIVQSVVEHVQNVPAMLAELYRVLKPGGKGMIKARNASYGTKFEFEHYLLHPTELIPVRSSLELEPGNFEQHEHNFLAHGITAYTLVSLLRQAQFKIIAMTTTPMHLRAEPGPFLKRAATLWLLRMQHMPVFKVMGPITLVKFKKPSRAIDRTTQT